MNELADNLWLRLPVLARRYWFTAGVTLSDGRHIRQWPRVAVVAPATGLLLGLVLGAIHPGVPCHAPARGTTAWGSLHGSHKGR